MGRLIFIIRILGALAFLACLFFFNDNHRDTAIIFGALASTCVAVVLTNEIAHIYQGFLLRKRRSS